MSDLMIADAGPADLADIHRLLETAGLSPDGSAESLAGFLVAHEDARLVATACLEACGTAGLLRSVATAPDERNRGLATRLVTILLNRAETHGYRSIYLLTNTAEGYFARFGFRRLDREQVPPEVCESGQFKSQTCAQAVVMGLGMKRDPITEEV